MAEDSRIHIVRGNKPAPKTLWAPIMHGKDWAGREHGIVLLPKNLPENVKKWVEFSMASQVPFNRDGSESGPSYTIAKNGEWTLVGIKTWSSVLTNNPQYMIPPGLSENRTHGVSIFFLAKGPLSEIPKPDLQFYSNFFEKEWHEKLVRGWNDRVERSGFDYELPGKPIEAALRQADMRNSREGYFPDTRTNVMNLYPASDADMLWDLAATNDKPVNFTIGAAMPLTEYSDWLNANASVVPDITEPTSMWLSQKRRFPMPDLGPVPSVTDASGKPINVRQCDFKGKTKQPVAPPTSQPKPGGTPVVPVPIPVPGPGPKKEDGEKDPDPPAPSNPPASAGDKKSMFANLKDNAGKTALAAGLLVSAAAIAQSAEKDKPKTRRNILIADAPAPSPQKSDALFKWASVALCALMGAGLFIYAARGARGPDQPWGDWLKNGPGQGHQR